MSAFPEVDFEPLRAGRYGLLSEPWLVACDSRARLEDFIRQQGVHGVGVLRVPSEGWEEYRGKGKVLLVLGGEGEALQAAEMWSAWEEWTFCVPPEHWEMETTERLWEEWREERYRRRRRRWQVAAMVAACFCALGAWEISTTDAGVGLLGWILGACGWVAAALTPGS